MRSGPRSVHGYASGAYSYTLPYHLLFILFLLAAIVRGKRGGTLMAFVTNTETMTLGA